MSRFITQGPGLLDEYFETLEGAAHESPLLRVGRLIDADKACVHDHTFLGQHPRTKRRDQGGQSPG